MRRFLPRSFFGQTVLVLVGGLMVSHLISMAIYSSDRIELLALSGGEQAARRVASIARLVNDVPTDWRDRILAAVQSPSLRVTLSDRPDLTAPADESWNAGLIRRFLAGEVGAGGQGDVIVRLAPASAAAGWPPAAMMGPQGAPGTMMGPQGGQGVMVGPQGGPGGMMGPGGPMGPGMMGGPSRESLGRRTAQGQRHLHMGWFTPSVAEDWPAGTLLQASIRLTDGGWINFGAGIPDSPRLWSGPALLSMGLMALTVTLFAVWVVRRLTRPLRTFAGAADRLGRDVHAPPLAEAGPLEIQQAARAFNRMQDRLRRLVDNRTRMLAAISHDLRTPITQLRLRAEFIEDAEEQAKTLATLDDMEAMIASTLAFARDDANVETPRTVDLAALVASLCDDLADAGKPVTFEPGDKVPFECRPSSLKRAIGNLVENAVKYGTAARVELAAGRQEVRIVVDDDGPGIPESDMENVFAPFFRLEGSRSSETGGVGLGLSVVRTIAHAHGGEVELANRPEGGLRATLVLPR